MTNPTEQVPNEMEEFARRGVISVTEATKAIIPGVEMSERIITIAKALGECACVWVPHTCLIGNISAGELLELADAVLEGGSIGEAPAPSKGAPQCPPVPRQLSNSWLMHSNATPYDDIQEAANWGFTQGLAAAQRLAAEERQRVISEQQEIADAQMQACGEWLESKGYLSADFFLTHVRPPRRPPAPSKREQAIKVLRERLSFAGGIANTSNERAMQLALQALEEAGDERCRPPAPSKREQAIKVLRERLSFAGGIANTSNERAMQLALQALEEAGDV